MRDEYLNVVHHERYPTKGSWHQVQPNSWVCLVVVANFWSRAAPPTMTRREPRRGRLRGSCVSGSAHPIALPMRPGEPPSQANPTRDALRLSMVPVTRSSVIRCSFLARARPCASSPLRLLSTLPCPSAPLVLCRRFASPDLPVSRSPDPRRLGRPCTIPLPVLAYRARVRTGSRARTAERIPPPE